MVRCIKLELWKAFHNSMFYGSLLIGVILSLLNIGYSYKLVNSFTVALLQMIEDNWPISKSCEGFSLFINWIGVNSVSLGSSLFNILWPILAAMPFGWSYSYERRSNYCNQVISRVNVQQYYVAKYIAVFVSGGIAVSVPVVFDLLVNALICPFCVPDVTSSILPIFNVSFLSKLYYTSPWQYATIWCFVKFLWGGVAASACWLLGSKCRFQSLIVLFPFGLFMLIDVISDLFCNLMQQKQVFSPMLLARGTTGACIPGKPIFLVMGFILILTIAVGYRQVLKNEMD